MYQDGRHRGTCHVDFVSMDGAVAAMTSMDSKPFKMFGRQLRVEFSEPKNRNAVLDPYEKLHYAGFAGEESEIRTIFQQFSDSIVKVNTLRDPKTGKLGQSGFVCFKSIESATKAMEALNGTQAPNGENLTVGYARPLRMYHKTSARLHYTLSFGDDESEIRTIFQQFNDSIVGVTPMKVIKKTGFITFNSEETAKEALEALNGTKAPMGENLIVSYALDTRRPVNSSRSKNTPTPKSES